MGGQFGPPIPGRFGPRPVQGGIVSPQQGTVPYQTPVQNQLVEGILNFVDGFKGVQEGEKMQARQRFLDAMQMLNLGLPIDMKKTARDARTAGFNFDFDGPTRAEQAKQGAPMPGSQGGIGGVSGGVSGGTQPPGGAPPVPGGGGGPGFFGRLGRAISDPFKQPPPIPGNAGVYDALGQMQERAQANISKEQMAAKILKTLGTAAMDSDEFMQAATLGELMGITKGLPDAMKDDMQVRKIAKALGIGEDEVRKRMAAISFGTDPKTQAIFMSNLAKAGISGDNLQNIQKAVMGGKEMKPEWFAIEGEGMVDPKESRKHWRSMYPKAPPQTWSALAALEAAGQWEGVDMLLENLGPSTAVLEQDRAASSEARAERGENRAARGEARAAAAEDRAERREAERIGLNEKERMASYYWALARQRIARGESTEEPAVEAISLLNKDAGSKQLDHLDVLDIESIINRKSGPGIEINIGGAGPPQKSGADSLTFGGN